jgi:hypothetical protein
MLNTLWKQLAVTKFANGLSLLNTAVLSMTRLASCSCRRRGIQTSINPSPAVRRPRTLPNDTEGVRLRLIVIGSRGRAHANRECSDGKSVQRTLIGDLPARAAAINQIERQTWVAEREGFEPSRRLPAYTRSRRAPSTTRPPLLFGKAPLAGRRTITEHPRGSSKREVCSRAAHAMLTRRPFEHEPAMAYVGVIASIR